MKPRPVVTACVCLALVVTVPGAASAQAVRSAVPALVLPAADGVTPELLASGDRLGAATLATLRTGAPMPGPFTPAPSNLRLSSGAKTAIIIGAVIVGVLIIVGVVALKGPGKKL
jgi:hypothetical protein